MTVESVADPGTVFVEARNLVIKLAQCQQEVEAAQALRYRVFYDEMAASPDRVMALTGRDQDSFDEHCDHLLVIDRERSGCVVGTYRLLNRAGARARGQFYSADEYDISQLLAYPGAILELGRSCVDADYRTGATMQLLWRGIAAYVFHYQIDVMFGCASLPGTELKALRLPLAYLHHYFLAPPGLRPRALDDRYVPMDRAGLRELDVAAARQALPPLIKGYLRLGGFVSDGAVVDEQFGTTDVCVVVKTDWVTEKYYRHYARESGSQSDGQPAGQTVPLQDAKGEAGDG